jgi:hypothetical protein
VTAVPPSNRSDGGAASLPTTNTLPVSRETATFSASRGDWQIALR